jgi:shikimate kinase
VTHAVAEAEPPVVLVGMMGSGKSTVGRILARRWGRRFLDSDEVIERRLDRTVAEIFRQEGEVAFRRLEAEALEEALEATPTAVVAAAGGVVLDPGNRALLQGAPTVVWLRAEPQVLLDRISRAGQDHRPLLDDDPAGVLRRMAHERTDLYAEVADAVVDVEGLRPEQVADAVELAVAGVGADPS